MTRSGLLARIAICGAIAGCGGSPSSPSGVPLFAEGKVADQQVTVESGRTGLYDYASAWRSTLSLSKDQRASRFAAIVKSNRR